MMNLLETILNAQNGGIVRQMANNLQLNESQARSAVGALIPALTGGISRNTNSAEGLDDLIGALGRGKHNQYIEDTSALSQQAALSEGNGILGHIFGSKEVSRQVAAQAAESSGVDSGTLKKMLPLLASVAMGALSKNGFGTSSGPTSVNQPSSDQSGGIGGLLAGFLDADKDGSAIDDILGMASKFLR